MRIARPGSNRARLLSVAATVLLVGGMLPAAVAAVAPAGAPTLQTPTAGQTVSSNPTFSWTAVTGATKYRFQVSTVSNFSALTYSVDTTNRKATPPADLPLGTLYWRVAGTDGAAGIGPFTDGTFMKQWGTAPTILVPASVDTFNFPTVPVLFQWQPLGGAKSYTIEIDDASDFIGATAATTTNTTYTLTEPQTVGQTFYWRLRATSSTGGVVSDWTATRQYDYTWSTVPTLVTPDNTTAVPVTDLVFGWTPVVGAKTYELQISPNGDWANNLVTGIPLVKGTRFSPPTTLGNGSYFWRVRAKDAKATPNNGGWSAEWQFTRGWGDRPTTVTPAWAPGDPAAQISGNMTFAWTPIRNASHYEIQTSHDVNFSPGDASTTECYSNHTRFTEYARITGSGEPGSCALDIGDTGSVYYWRVRGIDAPSGVLGLWSQTGTTDTARFIRIPQSPTQTGPVDGATVETPVLTWAAVPNVEKYIVTIKKSDQSTSVGGTPATTFGLSYTPLAALTITDGPFYWYVQGVNANGVTSNVPASGTWRTFNIVAPTTTTNLALLAPADLSSSVRMPSLTWEPFTGATYYKVRYGSNGFVNPTPLSGGTQVKFAGFTYAALTLAPDTYFWFVEAYDGTGKIGETAALGYRSFTITEASTLGTSDYTGPTKCTPLDPCSAERDTPTLTWVSTPNAGAYEVTIANDANFTSVVRRYVTAYTTLTPRESLVDNQAGQAFYWFVRPCIDILRVRCGPGSDDSTANDNASAFQKRSKAISLAFPADGATVANEVTFTWTDYLATNLLAPFANNQEAKTYRIDVSLVSDFATIFETATVDQTTYTAYARTYPEGPLYWRVQAIDGSGNVLTSSGARVVNKVSPALTTTHPTNASVEPGVPYFSWTPQAYAATYTVELYKNGDTAFSPANLALSQATKFSAWSPTTALAAGVYAWRVRRADADSRAGPWSAAQTFTLGPAATTLVSPANAATVDPINFAFTWAGVPGAVQYTIEVAPTCSFLSSSDSQTTVMTSWAPTKRYADAGYCWRVKSLDASLNVLSTSATSTFSVGSAAPPPTASASTYVPVTPVRLLDSRIGNGLSGRFTASSARTLQVTGRGGIPAAAIAVTGNLAVTNQTAGGYLAMTPTPTNNPTTSNLNFPLGDVRANNVTTPLSGTGTISIVYKAPGGKTTHVVFDVTGYFLENLTAATYKPIDPIRLLDTRVANGLSGKFTSRTPRTWTIAGGSGSIPSNAIAVTGNLAVVGQSAGGWVSLGPVATSTPSTSNINFPLADIRANGLTVKLAPDGNLSAVYIARGGATTHLVFDVTGYYVNDLTGSKFVPLTPVRRMDTRTNVGLAGKFRARIGRTLAINGNTNVPANATAVTGNLAVVNQTGVGYLAMTQATTNAPSTATLNFPVGDIRANGVTGPVTAAGTIGIVYVAGGGKTTDVVLDITGYFAP